MLPDTKKSGFTLVELLIATAIIGGLSVVGAQLLSGTLSSRAKQTAIEGANDNLRLVSSHMTKAIQSADMIMIAGNSVIKITGDPCYTIRYDSSSQSILEKLNPLVSGSCTPPDVGEAGFSALNKSAETITKFELSPADSNQPKSVMIEIQGYYQDRTGEHTFNLNIIAVPRSFI